MTVPITLALPVSLHYSHTWLHSQTGTVIDPCKSPRGSESLENLTGPGFLPSSVCDASFLNRAYLRFLELEPVFFALLKIFSLVIRPTSHPPLVVPDLCNTNAGAQQKPSKHCRPLLPALANGSHSKLPHTSCPKWWIRTSQPATITGAAELFTVAKPSFLPQPTAFVKHHCKSCPSGTVDSGCTSSPPPDTPLAALQRWHSAKAGCGQEGLPSLTHEPDSGKRG